MMFIPIERVTIPATPESDDPPNYKRSGAWVYYHPTQIERFTNVRPFEGGYLISFETSTRIFTGWVMLSTGQTLMRG